MVDTDSVPNNDIFYWKKQPSAKTEVNLNTCQDNNLQADGGLALDDILVWAVSIPSSQSQSQLPSPADSPPSWCHNNKLRPLSEGVAYCTAIKHVCQRFNTLQIRHTMEFQILPDSVNDSLYGDCHEANGSVVYKQVRPRGDDGRVGALNPNHPWKIHIAYYGEHAPTAKSMTASVLYYNGDVPFKIALDSGEPNGA